MDVATRARRDSHPALPPEPRRSTDIAGAHKPPRRHAALRRRVLVGLAAAVGALAVAGSIALLAGPVTKISGHEVGRPRTYSRVAHVAAPSTVECPSATVIAAAWDTSHVDSASKILGVSCADGWAVSAIDTNGYTTTGLFLLDDQHWQWTDRSVPCSTHQVPVSLYQDACKSN